MCPSKDCPEYNSQIGRPSLLSGPKDDDLKVLTSPNYPNSYSNSYSSTKTLEFAEPSTIKLKITNFNTEGGCDFLSIYDEHGNYWINDPSGDALPTPAEYTFNSTKVYVAFRTDGSQVSSGWRLEYYNAAALDHSQDFCT